ncbi:hypothetical protein [Nocardia sp. NPDC051463]|uniref:hypothetical protein n=1 Tax=Nocardia sp. NPDC051463 TaxID=3154845 RepID=UPI0034255A4B
MIGFVGKLGAGMAIAAAVGVGAAPAGATTLPLEPAAETAMVVPVFAPETGSAGIYNEIMCRLHTLSASVPCMYT